jgi:uncharacterized membrane protein
MHSFHISETDAKSEYIDDDKSPDLRMSKMKDQMKEEYNMEEVDKANNEAMKNKLKLVERKICYAACFFIMHVIAINSFDTGIISIVTFFLTAIIYALLNIVWYQRRRPTFALYILPVIASSFEYWLGSHVVGQQTS